MTNEIMVRGTQEFMGIEIPVIEGGFGKGCKCVTDKTVSEIHDIPAREIRRIIKDNSVRCKKVLMSLIYLNVWATPTRWT